MLKVFSSLEHRSSELFVICSAAVCWGDWKCQMKLWLWSLPGGAYAPETEKLSTKTKPHIIFFHWNIHPPLILQAISAYLYLCKHISKSLIIIVPFFHLVNNQVTIRALVLHDFVGIGAHVILLDTCRAWGYKHLEKQFGLDIWKLNAVKEVLFVQQQV